MLAARLARVPVRIHTFTGQVWATRSGWSRTILKAMDRVIASCATHILVDSASQKEFLCRQGVLSAEKASVLANGSISGVDIERFKPDGQARQRLREELQIPAGAFVFLFIGRLNPDKGVLSLVQAFVRVAAANPDAHLLVVGPDEAGMRTAMEKACGAMLDRVRFVGYTDKPEQYMAASDVFVLASRREGFGSVVIEAAAAGIPSIASRIYGLTDALEDGVTGLLHAPADSADLAAKMNLLAESPDTVRKFALAARARAQRLFTSAQVTLALEEYYRKALPPEPQST
jgi:glycosyltransferase involved in cell wall biosynthesis